jgi:4'-phosphopantetheinyl transferase EntD
VIGGLLPPGVKAVEAFGDVPGEPVHPAEEDLVARAVESRRREFVTTRRCAREALARLGASAGPIRSGMGREPLWPPGVTGSMTHCAGYRAAAVARTGTVAALGIDAEPHDPLPEGVVRSVTVPGETEMLAALAMAHPGIHWDRLLFSAKESVYKAWFPLTRRWLGFEDARLSLDPEARTFTARLSVDGSRIDNGPALAEMKGRYLVESCLVLTAVIVPPAAG